MILGCLQQQSGVARAEVEAMELTFAVAMLKAAVKTHAGAAEFYARARPAAVRGPETREELRAALEATPGWQPGPVDAEDEQQVAAAERLVAGLEG